MTETLTLPKTVMTRLLEANAIGSEYVITENGGDAEFGFGDNEQLEYFTHFDTVSKNENDSTVTHLVIVKRNSDDMLFGYTAYGLRDIFHSAEDIIFTPVELHEEVIVTRTYSTVK